MGLQTYYPTIAEIVEGFKTGSDVQVLERGSEKILRISWLNILNKPSYFHALAHVIASEMKSRGYMPDAIASIETSGAKYGVALSMETGLPYFSIHKNRKLIFQDTVEEEGRSVTESRDVRLYLDRSVASRFKSVVLVDDIRRSSRTLDAAARLLDACNVGIEACFVILDLAFAGHSPPSTIPEDRYHPLLVISSVDREGRCSISGGIALKHSEGHV